MDADESLDDPGNDGGDEAEDAQEQDEFTPEQVEAMRKAAESNRKSLPFSQLGFFRESMLMDFAAIAQAHRAMLARVLDPLLDTRGILQKRLTTVNSDILKNFALSQSELYRIVSRFAGNIDFGATESAAKIAANFTEQQAAWREAIAAMHAAVYPPNLQDIDGLDFEEIDKVVMVDGIPLYGLPRTSIAKALIRAESVSDRRTILGRRWQTISADCRIAIHDCSFEAVSPFIPSAAAALDALDAGHWFAAQALAGSLIDTLVKFRFGDDRPKYTPDKKGKRTNEAYDEFTVREYIAFAPTWQAYQLFFASDGDKVPSTFNRHATAHTVSPRQFNRRNAIQAIMFASSMLHRLDEEALNA